MIRDAYALEIEFEFLEQHIQNINKSNLIDNKIGRSSDNCDNSDIMNGNNKKKK